MELSELERLARESLIKEAADKKKEAKINGSSIYVPESLRIPRPIAIPPQSKVPKLNVTFIKNELESCEFNNSLIDSKLSKK